MKIDDLVVVADVVRGQVFLGHRDVSPMTPEETTELRDMVESKLLECPGVTLAVGPKMIPERCELECAVEDGLIKIRRRDGSPLEDWHGKAISARIFSLLDQSTNGVDANG